MAGLRTRFYRDKRRGKVAGVCAGLAEYYGVKVGGLRLGAALSFLFTGPIGPLSYLIAAMTVPARPAELDAEVSRQDPEEQKFWKEVRRNPHATARSVRARFRDIERRLAAAEAYLTSPDKRLAREIDRLR